MNSLLEARLRIFGTLSNILFKETGDLFTLGPEFHILFHLLDIIYTRVSLKNIDT